MASKTLTLSEVCADLHRKAEALPLHEAIPYYLQLARHYYFINGRIQKSYLDKILACNGLADKDANHIQARLLLSAHYLNVMDFAAANELSLQALADAVSTGNEELIIIAKQASCLVAVYNGRQQDAEQYIADCLQYVKGVDDTWLRDQIYTTAAFYNLDKDLAAATKYAMLAHDHAKNSNEPWRVGSALLTLTFITFNNDDLPALLSYAEAATAILKEQGATEYYANGILQISNGLKISHRYDEALEQLRIVEKIYLEIGISRHIIGVYSSYGRIYRALKQYDEAIVCYNKAIDMARQEGNTYEEGATYALMAQMYMDIAKLDEAIECFEKTRKLLHGIDRTYNNMTIVKYLHQLYRKKGRDAEAYDALLSYTEMRFKLQDEVRIKEVVALQEKYEAGKREAELQQIKLQQAESELKALKAQMNPHFVFNALNSIQEVFFLGDKRLANKHLSRFSTLIRNILKVSGQTSILLHDEVNMLQEYLELEALRFGDTFSYSVDIDEEIDVYNIDVPPMIVQPFVENAIKHGLMHRQGEQQLKLSIRYNQEHNTLLVCVSDNGVGRAASADINQYRQGHQSFATTALQKRFEFLNMKGDQRYSFEYVDLYNDNTAAGTEVYIHIPIKN